MKKVNYIVWTIVGIAALMIYGLQSHYDSKIVNLKLDKAETELKYVQAEIRIIKLQRVNQSLSEEVEQMSDDIQKALVIDSTIFERSKDVKLDW